MDNQVWKQRARWSKYALGLFILAVIISGAYFLPQTIIYYKLRPMLLRSNNDPPKGWSSAPTPLTETAVSTKDGTTISQFGVRFEVPWHGIENERNQPCAAEFAFQNGPAVSVSDPGCPEQTPIGSYLPYLLRDDVGVAFPLGVRESKYEQYRAVISAKPSDMFPFLSHKDFARVWLLLQIKGLWFEPT